MHCEKFDEICFYAFIQNMLNQLDKIQEKDENFIRIWSLILKFIFSKKATEIDEIFIFDSMFTT